MKSSQHVFIATSLDGYIADSSGGIDWLNTIPNPEQIDMGYFDFISEIDAIVMGRNTFETVCNFGIPWPYSKPVFVLSHSMYEIPKEYINKIQLLKGDLNHVLKTIQTQGYHKLYIDGGKTIQAFLNEDLIDELIITTIPILLGSGIPLFGELEHSLHFACVETKRYLDTVVQSKFIRTTK